MCKNVRTAKVLVNEEWLDIDLLGIKNGMTFKLFEEDGTPVTCEGTDIFTALDNAYMNKYGIICVKISLFEKEKFQSNKGEFI